VDAFLDHLVIFSAIQALHTSPVQVLYKLSLDEAFDVFRHSLPIKLGKVYVYWLVHMCEGDDRHFCILHQHAVHHSG